MKKIFAISFYLLPLFSFCQNEILLTGSAGVSSGFAGDFFKVINKTFVDYNGQEIGKFSTLETNYGANVGCRAETGVQWRGFRTGFRFGYDRLFLRTHKFKMTPQMAGFNSSATPIRIDYNVFSFGAYLAYEVKVAKRLNIVPEISAGSFTGFLRNYNASIVSSQRGAKWGFHHFMSRKFQLSVACRFEIPVNPICIFIAPEYNFIFYRNTIFSPTTDKTLSHISSGVIQLGVCGNIHKFLLKGKNSK